MKFYGIFHIDGHRSQNYPWTYECPIKADEAIGKGVTNPVNKEMHRSRYVVRELPAEGKSIQDAESNVFAALEQFSDELLEQLSLLGDDEYQADLLHALSSAELSRRDILRGPK